MLSFTIMTGCASISNRPTNSSEGGTQSLKEMLPLIKLPVKKVSIFSCAHLRVLYGQKLSVQVAEKYSEASQKNMEAFFKTSADLFKNAGYEVEIENLPSSACYDPDSLVGETDTLTLMVVSSAHENIIGYQQLYVQCSIILHGQKGRHFSQQTTISNLWGLSYSPVNAAAEVMSPIIDLLKSVKSAK